MIFSTHRPVGHLLAKGASIAAITAEIWGKANGCAGGKGGQMHLVDVAVGAMPSNAIVGANIPIATGAAIGFRLRGLDRVAVSFFGDGAANIGAFHEGINFAAVRKAPGGLRLRKQPLCGIDSHVVDDRRSPTSPNVPRATESPVRSVDGMDVIAVYRSAAEAVRARPGRSRADAAGVQDLPLPRPFPGRSGRIIATGKRWRNGANAIPSIGCRALLMSEFGMGC